MIVDVVKTQLVRGALGSGFLSITHKGLGLVLSILLARWLGAENYGYYAFAVSLMGLLAVPGQLGLPQFLTREVALLQARENWQAMALLRKRALRILGWGVVGSTLSAFVILAVSGSAPAIDTLTVSFAIALLPLLILSEFISGLLRGLRKVVHAMWPTAALKPAGTILGVVLLVVVMQEGISPAYVMFVNVAVSAVALAILVFLLARFWPDLATRARAAPTTVAGFGSLLSFTLLGASNIIVQKTDVVMLGFLSSADDVGVYHVLVQGAMVVSFGFAAVNSVLSPNIARLAAAGDKARLQRLMSLSSLAVLAAALLILTILILFGESVLGIVFGEEFRRGYIPLLVLGFGQLVNASVGSVGTFLSMTGHEKATLNAILVAAVVNVILNWILIPFYGIVGAAIATMLSTLLWNAIMSVAVYKRLGIVPGPFKFGAGAGRNG